MLARPLVRPLLLLAFGGLLLPSPPVSAVRATAYHPNLTNLGPGATYRWHPGSGGVHVVTVSAARLDQLRVVVAHDRVDGGRETVASMCRRHGCLAAVNGDFFGPRDDPGGIIRDRRVYRSATAGHEQLVVHPPGAVRGTQVTWDATLDLGGGHRVTMPVNVVADPPAITLFTSRFAGRPPAYVGSVALLLKRANARQPVDVLGSAVRMTVVALRPLAAVRYVPPGWAVAVGRGVGAARLHDVYRQVQRRRLSRRATLRWDASQQVLASLGGHPVVIRDGRVVLDPHDPITTTRHRRTLAAGGRGGQVWLIVTDRPMTLFEAARMLLHWHATWAVNLDGGGSASMVLRGHTVNQLQDRRPRAVGSALLLVRASDVRRAHPHAVHARPASRPAAPPASRHRRVVAVEPGTRPAVPVASHAPAVASPRPTTMPADGGRVPAAPTSRVVVLRARPLAGSTDRRVVPGLVVFVVLLLAGSAAAVARRGRRSRDGSVA